MLHRFLGLLLLLVGLAGGWWLGRPPAAVQKIPATEAWRFYKAEAARAQMCEGDVDPHPAWVALGLAAATFTLLTTAAAQPRRAWQIALGLRSANVSVAVPW